MKTVWTTLTAVTMVFCFSTAVKAEEVTKKGTIACAMCTYGKETGAKKCALGIMVKEGDKDVFYYFDADAHKKYHGPDSDEKICKKQKKGTVKGEVSKDGDKMIIKVSEVKFD